VGDKGIRQRRGRREERFSVVGALIAVAELVEQHYVLTEEQLGEPELLRCSSEVP
jgi:hypothetical protein